MQTKPLGLGVIGCGNVLQAYAQGAQALLTHGRVRWTAACGRLDQESRVQSLLGEVRFSLAPEDVLKAPDVDVVVILTSMGRHGDLAAAALRAGKHVLVEKPLATQVTAARELLALAQHNDRFLICAPFTPLSPTARIIKARLDAGDIGQVTTARGRYGWAGPDWSDWFYKEGAGPLLDLAVYNVTTLLSWLGPARRVVAMTGTAISQRDVGGRMINVDIEDNAQILIETQSGASLAITAGYTIQQYRSPALEVYGTEGTIQMRGDDWDPDGYEIFRPSVGAWESFKETAPDWSWTSGLTTLVEAVETGSALALPATLGLHVLEVLEAARHSGLEGRAVDIQSSFAPLILAPPDSFALPHRQHDRTRREA